MAVTFPESPEQVIRDRFQRQANELRMVRDNAALRKLDSTRAGDTKLDLFLGGKIEGLEIAIRAIEMVVGEVDRMAALAEACTNQVQVDAIRAAVPADPFENLEVGA